MTPGILVNVEIPSPYVLGVKHLPSVSPDAVFLLRFASESLLNVDVSPSYAGPSYVGSPYASVLQRVLLSTKIALFEGRLSEPGVRHAFCYQPCFLKSEVQPVQPVFA